MKTYLYVIEAKNDVYKIGIADDVARRFRDLDRYCPVELRLKLCIEIDWLEKHDLDRELRHYFGHKCRKGEWFELNEEDLNYIACQGKLINVSKFVETINGIECLSFKNGATRYALLCPNCKVKGSAKRKSNHLELVCRNCGIATSMAIPIMKDGS